MAHGGGTSGITCFGSSSCCSFPQFPGEKEEKNGGGEGKCILLNLFGVKEKEREGKISYGHVGKSREQKCILELFQKKKEKKPCMLRLRKKEKKPFSVIPTPLGFFLETLAYLFFFFFWFCRSFWVLGCCWESTPQEFILFWERGKKIC